MTSTVIELELSPSLREKGVSKITNKNNNTIGLEINGECYVSTIYKSDSTKTINNLLKMVDGSVDKEIKREITLCVSKNWTTHFACNDNDTGQGGEGGHDEEVKKSQTAVIIEMVEDSCKLFKDQYEIGYALVRVKEHYESMMIKSDDFKWYLMNSYRNLNPNRPATMDSINNAINNLQGITRYDKEMIPLHVRVAQSEDKNTFYYDLTDEDWRCIKIDRKRPDILIGLELNFPLFKRYSQTSQPIPDLDFKSDIFDQWMSLTNVKKDDTLLAKVAIISIFIPNIQRIIFLVHGGQDAAKSTFQFLVKDLTDPDRPKNLLSLPHDKDEFQLQLAHRHVTFYDNLKEKKSFPWLATEVCIASTGGGSTKRKLYSDEDDVIWDLQLTQGFNGINMVLNEPDVLRRSLLFELESIEEENKVEQQVIIQRATELKPYLLGYILITVSKAMSIKDTLELKKKPGLADFVMWGEAISRAMGYPEMEFVEAYRRNIDRQNEEVIESDSFAKTISLLYEDIYGDQENNIRQKFKEIEGIWWISGNELLEELYGIASRSGIDISGDWFPKSVNKISRKLRTIRSNLKGMDIDVIIKKATTEKEFSLGFTKNLLLVGLKKLGLRNDSNDNNDTSHLFDEKNNYKGVADSNDKKEEKDRFTGNTVPIMSHMVEVVSGGSDKSKSDQSKSDSGSNGGK